MKHLEKAIEYVRANVEMEEVNLTISRIYKQHSSLECCDPFNLYDKIYDLMEEYGDDNDLPEGWWLYETEVEDILLAL